MTGWRLGGVALLLLGLSGCPAEPAGPVPLRVAMDPRIGQPFVYASAKDQYAGFEVELSQYLAEKLERPLEIVPLRWPTLPEAVRKRRADLALNAIEKPGKGLLPEQLAITEHYYTAYQQLAVRAQDKFTYNLSDLTSKKVGVVSGSVAELLLEELNQLKKAEIQIEAFASPEAVFAALSAGKLQATLTERAFASWYRFQNQKTIRLTGEPITAEVPYVGLVRAEDAELRKDLNRILLEGRKDPVFRKIFDKWHVSIQR